MMTRKIPTGECPVCGYRKRIRQDGNLYGHKRPVADGTASVCPGAYGAPVDGTQYWPNDDVLYPVAPASDNFETSLRALVFATAVVTFLVAFGVVWAVFR